jgi:hypothetical protein
MALLQHHLGDTEMEMIFSCMDSHGYLTPDQVGTDTALGPRQHRFYCYCYCYMVQDLPEHPVGSQRGSWGISVIIRTRVDTCCATGCWVTYGSCVVGLSLPCQR